jgi:hypothetical protein
MSPQIRSDGCFDLVGGGATGRLPMFRRPVLLADSGDSPAHSGTAIGLIFFTT